MMKQRNWKNRYDFTTNGSNNSTKIGYNVKLLKTKNNFDKSLTLLDLRINDINSRI